MGLSHESLSYRESDFKFAFIGVFEEPFKGQPMFIRTTGTALTVGVVIAVSIL